ncbi:MAG TPA: c-type cytochrome [Aliidongia sp.]|nr:c-type cytochrome [Aliidongia sp.]
MNSSPMALQDGHRRDLDGSVRLLGRILGLAGLLAATACGSDGQVKAGTGTVAQDEVDGTVHVCASCHGLDGRSISPTFPRLAGQQAVYLETQLKAFRDKTRADPHAHTYMWGMAAHLSDPLIQALAAYFAAEPPAPGTPADPTEMAAGRKIFEEGIPDREVPPCQTCHGEHAEGQDSFPRLAGQHRDYLAAQLENFASNARENEIMHENSKHLSAGEIRDVTAYLAAQ